MANSSKMLVLFMMSKVLILTTLVKVELASAGAGVIPADHSKIDEWLARNMRKYVNETRHFKYALDGPLAAAERSVRVIKVKQDGTGHFKTVTEAVDSIPRGNTRRVVVWIGGGVYREKITVDRYKPFVTFYGDGGHNPTLTFDGTASKYGTWNSATVAVESAYFIAVNIAFVNSAPMPDNRRDGEQAVAMRISGDKAAFHNCRFIGYQDTLCDDKGRHFFRNCYIQGTVDFIFGDGKSIYLNTKIVSVAKGLGAITAQARNAESEDSGFSFIYCNVTGTGDTYLGRAWKERPRVVFAYTYMGSLINPEGWSNRMYQDHNRTCYYGEYKCLGPGSSTAKRESFVKRLTNEQVKPFMSMTYIQGNKWLLRPKPNSPFSTNSFSTMDSITTDSIMEFY